MFEAVLSPKAEDVTEEVVNVLHRSIPEESLGGSKTRGFGKVSFKDLEVMNISIQDIQGRAEKLNPGCFSLRCVSPLIVDKSLEPSTVLEGARRAYSWVFHEGKPSLPEVELVASRASQTHIGGWSMKTNRPLRKMNGYNSGSIFQFSCKKPTLELSEALAALEVYPLGGYKPYGCGQFLVKGCREGSRK
jgi:hypothetical protein